MRRAAILALAAAAFAWLPGASAQARPPKPSDTPVVEDLYQQAKKAIDDKAKAAAEAARDPLKEAIEAYRDGKTPLTDYDTLVTKLLDAKDDKVQPYRPAIAVALTTRFDHEEQSDPQIKAVRREIAKKLLDLMIATKDDVGLRAVEDIFNKWWRPKMAVEVKFHATDPLADRKRARDRMKKLLDKGDN